jgi:hypothetical protein
MSRNRKLALIGIPVAVVALATAGFAIAGGVGDNDEPLTGATLARATAAALEHTGGGKVVETETGDGGAAYGVEVQLAGGRQVEVELDENFEVIGQETDDDEAGEAED